MSSNPEEIFLPSTEVVPPPDRSETAKRFAIELAKGAAGNIAERSPELAEILKAVSDEDKEKLAQLSTKKALEVAGLLISKGVEKFRDFRKRKKIRSLLVEDAPVTEREKIETEFDAGMLGITDETVRVVAEKAKREKLEGLPFLPESSGNEGVEDDIDKFEVEVSDAKKTFDGRIEARIKEIKEETRYEEIVSQRDTLDKYIQELEDTIKRVESRIMRTESKIDLDSDSISRETTASMQYVSYLSDERNAAREELKAAKQKREEIDKAIKEIDQKIASWEQKKNEFSEENEAKEKLFDSILDARKELLKVFYNETPDKISKSIKIMEGIIQSLKDSDQTFSKEQEIIIKRMKESISKFRKNSNFARLQEESLESIYNDITLLTGQENL